MNHKYFIPERFEKEIVLHALRVYNKGFIHAPIMLAIDGPTGEGKTYQCSLVLERIGCKVFPLSAGQFESKDAGAPAELLRSTYNSAVDYMKESPENLAAMLIDDADVAFGNWGQMVQYTVNTQGVIGELMNIANYPVEEDSIRVPIYLTGNDLKKIYAPLRRTGRMDFFFWKPTISEKSLMVFYLLDYLSYENCEELVSYVETKCNENNLLPASISFYSTMISHMYDNMLWDSYLYIKQNSFGKLLLSRSLCLNNSEIGIEELKVLADNTINQIILSNNDYTGQMKGL